MVSEIERLHRIGREPSPGRAELVRAIRVDGLEVAPTTTSAVDLAVTAHTEAIDPVCGMTVQPHRTPGVAAWQLSLRGALVIIASDGWDSDEPAHLERALTRVRRRAHRVVWLTPVPAIRTFGHLPEPWPPHCPGAPPSFLRIHCPR